MSTVMASNRTFSEMVARQCYDDEQSLYRRFSSRDDGYPSNHRILASGSNHNIYSRGGQYIGDFRSNSPDQGEVPHTRRRIPVACGRCRKRKIRCSGDNGGPCDNCKTVGNEICQFLRVSSTETTMIKNENPVLDLDNGSAGSRINCQLVSCGPHSQAIQSPSSLGPHPFPQRNNSMPTYQYPVKQYPLPNYDFGEEGLEYGLTTGSLALHLNTFQGDQMGVGTNYMPAQRTWASTTQLKNLPFLDQQAPTYNHGQSPYNGTNFDARQNINPEPKPSHLAMQSFPLPTPINTGMDRYLPLPATAPINRQQPHQYALPMDGLLPATYGRGPYGDYNSQQTLKSNNGIDANNIGNGNSNGALVDPNDASTGSYPPPLTQSPVQSLNSAQTAYSSSSFSLPSSQPEVFSPPQSSYASPQNEYDATLNANEAADSYDSRKNSYAPAQTDDNGVLNTTDASGSYNPRKTSFTSSQNNPYNLNEAETPDSYDSRKNSYTVSQNHPYGILNAAEAPQAYNHSNTSYERRSSYADYKSPSGGSSQVEYHQDGLPSLSTNNNTLVNGHRYYPASSNLSNQYPAPSINIQPQARRPSGVLA